MTKSGEKYTTENGVARQDGFKDGGWLKRTNWNGDFMVIYGDFMVF